MLAKVEKIWRNIESVSCIVAAGILGIIMGLTCADVIGRYFFNHPIPGALEITESLMVGVVFLSIAYIQSKKGHTKMELLLERLPKKAQVYLAILGVLTGIFVFVVFAWSGGSNAWSAWVTGDYREGVIRVPYWPSKMLIPIGCFMIFIRFIFDLIADISELRKLR